MARFANTIDELPIYAARAEADKNGDVIDTTYQKKLTAGSGITIDEDNVISATGGGGGDLPPSTSSDEGKVLTVDSSGDPVWDDPQSDLPSSSSADEGKVLTVASNGEPQWAPSSGGVGDIFLATYGTTTFDEIKTAHNAGKAVFLYAQAVNYITGRLLPLESCFRSNDTELSNARFILPFYEYPSVGANSAIRHNTIFEVNGNNVWSTRNLSAIASPEASDVGKIYTATDAGKAMWVNQRTPGNMLSVTNNQIDVTTTAGITDIQMVNALPANPVATVLYLIPET